MSKAYLYRMYLSRLRSLLWAMFAIAPAVFAQQAEERPSIRVDVSLANVSFTVRDANGRLVPNLKAEDFEVFEDGAPRPIKFFGRAAELPLRLALLVDGSGSQEKFNRQHHADLENFLRSALTNRDRALLIGFGNRIRLASDFSSEPSALIEALTRFEKSSHSLPELDADSTREGGTALFDAICAASSKIAMLNSGRKAIVLLSDGEDNASAHDVVDAIEAAQNADAIIYTVRYTQPRKGGVLTAHNRFGTTEMMRLAKDTGGAAFNASQGGVAESLRQIADELRSLYDIGYTATSEADGTFHKLTIRPKTPGLTVRAKSGYYAK